MTLHLPTIGKAGDPTCAYSTKAERFAEMFPETILYDLPSEKPADDDLPAWDPLNAEQAERINERAEPGDLLLIPFGVCQQTIASRLPHMRAVEYGIGYGGTFADFRVFESRAWQATVYGSQQGAHGADGRFYDAVIPNFFDPDDFPLGAGGDYLLYVGRLTERKGLQIVLETAERTGLPLVVAGAGEYQLPEWVDYRGVVAGEEKAKLMGEARALLCPTLYLEPFGGVAVEAQMCGTPAISTDFGAFPETVEQGVSGFRCRRMDEFVSAVEQAGDLDREAIRARAVDRFSLDAVRPLYEDYFDHLSTLDGAGFNT